MRRKKAHSGQQVQNALRVETEHDDGDQQRGDHEADGCTQLQGILGKEFMGVYAAIKREEYETFMQVISPWEREYLLLNV